MPTKTKKPVKYWCNYGGHRSPDGRVHSAGCTYYGIGHGVEAVLEEVPETSPDCKICGGAHRG